MSALRFKTIFGLIALFIFLSIVQDSKAGFFYGKENYYTIKTQHFYIHYPEGLGPVAEEMRTISEETYNRLTVRLNWKPKGRTHVVMSNKTDQANGLATVIPYHYILLYVAKPTADSSLDVYKDYLRLLFTHEYTHLVHIDMNHGIVKPFRYLLGYIASPNGATPAWMREGMAVYEESLLADGFGRINSYFTDMVLRTSIYENTFPRIDQIAGLTARFPGGYGPYLFGSEFFEWLSNKYGKDKIYNYQKRYSSSLWLFSLNNKAKKVYGKSFYQLWKDFKVDLTQRYGLLRDELTQLGLTSFQTVIKNKDSQIYFTPRPNSQGYAYYQTSFDDDDRIVIVPQAGAKPIELKQKLFGQMTFSKDGRYLAFSVLASVEPKTAHSEVYYYDLEKKKLYRVRDEFSANKAMKIRDPDFSSKDGGNRWLVTIRNFLDTDQLYIFDTYEKKGYVITHEPKNTQFSNPRFSPDGKEIVVSRKDSVTGQRDIYIYSDMGAFIKQVTNDIVPDNHPIYSWDGKSIYFDSFRSGVSNIYSYNFAAKALYQITNVLDGVFQPMPNFGSSEIYVQRYNSENTFIQKFDSNYTNPRLQKVSIDSSSDKIEGAILSGQNYSINVEGNTVNLYEHPTNSPEETDPDQKISQNLASLKNDTTLSLAKNTSLPTTENLPQDHVLSLTRFGNNPESSDFLPQAFFTQKANADSEDDTTSVKTVEAPKQSDYPSEYKDLLDPFPPLLDTDKNNPSDAKKYNAFPQILVPRYVLPSLAFFENTVLLGAAIGRHDPLFRQSWTAFVNYRTDANFVGAGATYVYSRYVPTFYVGGIRYAVDWGTLNFDRFFEQRHQVYGGIAFPIKKHRFNLSYFYEHRKALSDATVDLFNMKPIAGFRYQYNISNFSKFTNSISQEHGYSLKIGGEWTDSRFGGNSVNDERTIRGDFRYYLEMPWSDHHVLALRAAGGTSWGALQQFGVYRLGGPFGEGVGANISSHAFPLRGLAGITFGGDDVFIYSAEYRLPIASNINWGLGTMPIFLDKIYFAFFSDGGDITFRTSTFDIFDRMMISVGGELNSTFVIGYGLPINFRMGYGIILTHRDRLGTLEDTTTRQSLKFGSVYFQFGTMF